MYMYKQYIILTSLFTKQCLQCSSDLKIFLWQYKVMKKTDKMFLFAYGIHLVHAVVFITLQQWGYYFNNLIYLCTYLYLDEMCMSAGWMHCVI